MKKKRYLFMIISILLFLMLIVVVKCYDANVIDKTVYNFISNNIIHDKFTPIVKLVTKLSDSIFLIILTIILFIFIKNKNISLSIMINLVCSFVINNILKFIIMRPRPDIHRMIVEKGYSFPSGHAMVSSAFYGYIIYLIWKYIKNNKIKYGLICLISLVIICVGFSRVYLGVHYTTDILGGWIFSMFYLFIFIPIMENKFLDNK